MPETFICGQATRCERHDNALHGYPCHACEEEHWRRYPRAREVIRQSARNELTSNRAVHLQITDARAADYAAREAYDGPHDVVVSRAGEHGPVSRRWNALCASDCGWARYWSTSQADAQAHADEHRAAPRG